MRLPPPLQCAVAACAAALACPGGGAWAASFPVFYAARELSVPESRFANLAGAALGAGIVQAGEMAKGMDTSSQSAMALSLCTSMGIVALTADDVTDMEEPADQIAGLKREALSARKSWDARLQWKERKKRKHEIEKR